MGENLGSVALSLIRAVNTKFWNFFGKISKILGKFQKFWENFKNFGKISKILGNFFEIFLGKFQNFQQIIESNMSLKSL